MTTPVDTLAPPDPPHVQLRWKRILGTGLACLLIVGGAAFAAGLFAANRKEAPRTQPQVAAFGVRTVPFGNQQIAPELVGLGRARPARTVEISARVEGEAIFVDAALEDGRFLPAGREVVRLDPIDHQRELDRLQAQLKAARARKKQLELQRTYLTSRVELARKLVKLERDELERLEQLDATIRTPREVETARLATLRARDSLIQLEMTRTLLGPQIVEAAAQVEEMVALEARALLSVERTQLALPFAGEVAHVAVEQHQQVRPGTPLFELWDTEQLEIPVVLSLEDALLIAPGLDLTVGHRVERIQVQPSRDQEGPWPDGVLDRFEPLDPDTQTVRAVVKVQRAKDGPRLAAGVFCRVRFQLAPLTEPVVPMQALRERNRVFLAREGRLAVQQVETGRRLGEWVVIRSGLAPGDAVIVSPVEQVVEGQAVEVVSEGAP